MTNSIYDDYLLEYNLFLAESELFNDLNNIYNISLNESDEIQVLNESVLETIKKYLLKIINGITGAFKKFKSNFLEGLDNRYLKSIENEIRNRTDEPSFSISDFRKFNDDKLNSINIIPLNYEAMKASLNTPGDYLKANYSNIDNIYKTNDNCSDLKDIIYNYVVEVEYSRNISLDDIHYFYKWCTETYKNAITSIEKDIKSMNQSSVNITNLVNSIQNTESKTESLLFFLNEQDDASAPKEKIHDDKKDNNNDKNDTNKELLDHIKTYMTANTKLLLAKFNILKERRSGYVNILKHYIKPTLKNEETNKENNNNTEAPQIK